MSASSISSTIFWLFTCALAAGLHFHAGRGAAAAARRQRALALDLHHAGAAVAVGRGSRACSRGGGCRRRGAWRLPGWIRRRRPATGWPSSAEFDGRQGHFGQLGRCVHSKTSVLRTAVQTPSGGRAAFIRLPPLPREKYFCTQRTGLGAAWPRPQIEASAITWFRSSSVRVVPLRRLASERAALSVPTRQGVHWPQLSWAKKPHHVERGIARLVVPLLSTMTAAEPMKQPCGCSVSKVQRHVGHAGSGRMPPEAPPGR